MVPCHPACLQGGQPEEDEPAADESSVRVLPQPPCRACSCHCCLPLACNAAVALATHSLAACFPGGALIPVQPTFAHLCPRAVGGRL